MATPNALPSAALVKAWNDDTTPGKFSDLLAWCRVTGALKTAFLTALDAEEDEFLRVLSMLPEAAAVTIIDSVKIGEAALNPLQKAKLHLFSLPPGTWDAEATQWWKKSR